MQVSCHATILSWVAQTSSEDTPEKVAGAQRTPALGTSDGWPASSASENQRVRHNPAWARKRVASTCLAGSAVQPGAVQKPVGGASAGSCLSSGGRPTRLAYHSAART